MAPPFDTTTTKEEWMSQISNVEVNRADMNKLIMNYLVTEGFKEAAEKFHAETDIVSDVPLDSLDDRIRIRDAILQGRISSAISMVNDLHPEILDNDRNCFFQLQQQFFIELIKCNEIDEAIEFAQTNLAEHVSKDDVTIIASLERALSLLAFVKPELSPFSDLISQTQRTKVANQVNTAILKYECKDTSNNISSIFKLLMWSQDQLDSNKIAYQKMTNLSEASF